MSGPSATDPTVEMKAYWQALGEFVTQFAQTEKAFQGVYWRYAGVSVRVGQALMSGLRLREMISLLPRALDVLKVDDPARADLDDVMVHLGPIIAARNDILHWGTEFTDGEEFKVHNKHIAHLQERVREFTVSVATLEAMTADLSKASAHLILHLLSGFADSHALASSFADELNAAWRYKSPPQVVNPQKRSGKPPKHQRRR